VSFSKRIPVVVDNTGGLFALTNHQVKIDLSLSAYANVFAVARSDGADIQVRAANKTTVLTYWLAPDFNGSSAGTLYALIPSLAIGASTTIYIYYGDASVSVSGGSYSNCMTHPAVDSDTLSLCPMDSGSSTGQTTALQDHFTGSNGTRLNAHTMNTGSGWTEAVGTWTIQSNKASESTTAGAQVVADAGRPDVLLSVSIDVPNTASYALGFTARYADANNWLRLIIERDGGGTPYLQVGRMLSGSFASLTTSNFGSSPTGTTVTMTASVIGYDLVLTCGSNVINYTFNVFPLDTKFGLYNYTGSGYTGGTFDDFLCTSPITYTFTDSAGLHDAVVQNAVPTFVGSDGGNWKASSPRVVFATGDAPILNGTSQYITFGSLFDTWPAAWSFDFWCRPDVLMGSGGAADYRIAVKYNAALTVDGLDLLASTASSNIKLVCYHNSVGVELVAAITTSLASGTWHHFAVSGGPAGLHLYINGRLEAYDAGGPLQNGGLDALVPRDGSSNPFTLGALNDRAHTVVTQFFPGAFDDFRAQQRQMLPEEVHAAYERRQWKQGMELCGRLATRTRSTSLSPSGVADGEQYQVLEPTGRWEGGTTWKQWYSRNDRVAGSIGYATSTDGDTWAKYGSNPVVGTVAAASCVISDGSTGYIMYYTDSYSAGGVATLWRRTSADGISWGSPTAVLASVASTWLDGISNSWVLRESATDWKMLVEGSTGSPPIHYKLGLFTSSDGITWSAYGSNPLTSLQLTSGGSASGAWFDKVNGVYRVWYHVSCKDFGPSSLAYAESTDLHTFTIKGGGDPVFFLAGETFSGVAADQVADPALVEANGVTKFYYDVDRNGGGAGLDARIDQITYPTTLAVLLQDLPWLSPAANESANDYVAPLHARPFPFKPGSSNISRF
jgi:hypothetical protein